MAVSALGYIGSKCRSRRVALLWNQLFGPHGRRPTKRITVLSGRCARMAHLFVPGKADDLAFAGSEVRDAASRASVCASLKAVGFEAVFDSAIAKRRGATGLQVEIYFGAATVTA